MSRPRPPLPHALATGIIGAVTTWLTVCGWAVFTEQPGAFLVPLLGFALVNAALGAVLRWLGLPGLLVAGVQLGLLLVLVCALLGGSPVPLPDTLATVRARLAAAVSAAQQYAAPVPAPAIGLGGVLPVLLAGGAVFPVLVDLLGGTLRRPALTGLPLLAAYSLPVSVLGDGQAWVFVGGAVGFCLLLALQEGDRLAGWGRSFGGRQPWRPGGRGEPTLRTGGVGSRAAGPQALALAGAAIVLGLSVPVMVPTVELGLLPGGNGSGDSGVSLTNPLVDLRRDLRRGEDVPLVRVRTEDPDPGYLRTAVLSRFNGSTWSTGDREIPPSQSARGPMPPLPGVRPQVPRERFGYTITVTEAFESIWLPTPAPVSEVTADGAWRYDEDTRDFLATDEGLSTAGLEYSATAVELRLDAVSMARSPSGSGAVADVFTDLPRELPELVERLAEEVTASAGSDFEKARALQRWFRTEGGFDYSLRTEPGSGSDDLVAFLRRGPGGRVGYCEQFAASMAVMARTLDVPARVAVGFLEPRQLDATVFEYSAHDLHAWTEVYISGAGWVRFEPTPADRARTPPRYTRQSLPTQPEQQPDTPSQSQPAQPAPSMGSGRRPEEPTAGTQRTTKDGDGFGTEAVLALSAVLLLGGLLATPRWLRGRRRARRWHDGPSPEQAWAELRDSAVDLRLPWPRGRSPRTTAAVVARWLTEAQGPAVLARTEQRARRSVETSAALSRVLEAVERARYAADAGAADGAAPALRADVELLVAALRSGAGQDVVLRADWWPASLFRRESGPVHDEDLSADHVGR